MNSIVQEIYNTSITAPDCLCIADAQGSLSYKEMWHEIRHVARCLKKLNLKKGDCIVGQCEQSYRFMVFNFACNLAGVIFVPVESKAANDFINKVIADVNASVIVTNAYQREDVTCISYDELWQLDDEIKLNDDDFEFPRLDDVAEILFTTGTTGLSKGIMITHRNNIALAQNISDGVHMREGNVELLPLPLSHSHGLRCSYANYYKHGAMVISDGVSKIKNVIDMIEKYKVCAMDVSPMAMSMLLFMTKGKIQEIAKKFDYIQIGTTALSDSFIKEMQDAFPNMHLYNSYGTTESGRSCMYDFGYEGYKKNCVGKPATNAEFKTVDENGCFFESDINHTGMIACKGPMNMLGYLNNPELTEQMMIDGYLVSCDEGYIDDEGYIYVLGRKDDVINYRGIKISPQEIEGIVMESGLVIDCACSKEKNELVGEIPVLFIEVENDKKYDLDGLKQYLYDNIDKNKVPGKIYIIDKIPRTYNGKIQRNKLFGKL